MRARFGPAIALIITNVALMGLSADKLIPAHLLHAVLWFDEVILWFFLFELALKLYGFGIPRFLKDPWNLFDALMVAISVMSTMSALSSFRVLRVLRFFRLITAIPAMQRVVAGLLKSIPAMGLVFFLVMILSYVFALIGTTTFGEAFPDWFGTMGKSAFSLFQIMTLESWSMGIARPVIQEFPNAWVFFIGFIIVSFFIFLNLIVGVIVSSIAEASEQARKPD